MENQDQAWWEQQANEALAPLDLDASSEALRKSQAEDDLMAFMKLRDLQCDDSIIFKIKFLTDDEVKVKNPVVFGRFNYIVAPIRNLEAISKRPDFPELSN